MLEKYLAMLVWLFIIVLGENTKFMTLQEIFIFIFLKKLVSWLNIFRFLKNLKVYSLIPFLLISSF